MPLTVQPITSRSAVQLCLRVRFLTVFGNVRATSRNSAPMGNLFIVVLIKHRKLAPLQEGFHIDCTSQSGTVFRTCKELLIHKPVTTHELYAATQQFTGLQSIWQP